MKRLTAGGLAAFGLWALAALPSSPAFSRTVYEGRVLYAKSWALVVGINRYASSRIPRLEYAEADARDMKAALVRLGFPEGNVRLVLGRKATRREILRVLEEDLNPKMAEGDRLFIYFSGHGVTTRVHGKQAGFLLAYDSVIYDWPGPGKPYMKRPPARALDMRTLMRSVEGLLPRHKLIAVDACFNGYAARSKTIEPVGVTPRRLRRWLSEPVIQVLTAGRAGQKAVEKGEYGHGVFTWHLLKGLAGNADEAGGGPGGLLSFDELAAYVRNRVSREPDVGQDPQAAGDGEGQFVFVLPDGAEDGREDEAERMRRERERLRREAARLTRERERLEGLETERRKLEAQRRRVEEEKRRIAALRKNVGAGPRPRPSLRSPKPPRVAVAPGAAHQIGSGLDAMVKVPAGWFIMGSSEEDLRSIPERFRKYFLNESPKRRVYLDAFYIDKYPVTNTRFRRSGKPGKDYGSKFNVDHQAVVGVTWSQGRDYCQSVGKRLPTEAEWEKAARGVDGRKYPWGKDWDDSKVISLNNSGGKTHPVDRTYNTHRSPYGAVDMAGNTWEWVADWFGQNYYANAPNRNPKGPASGDERVLRGGSWDYAKPWNFRAANRLGFLPDYRYSWLSFRCAKASK